VTIIYKSGLIGDHNAMQLALLSGRVWTWQDFFQSSEVCGNCREVLFVAVILHALCVTDKES